MNYHQCCRDIQRGDIALLYLLIGEESLLVREFIRLLRRKLDIAADSLNFLRFEGRGADDVLSACNTMTFDRKTRLVLAVNPRGFGGADESEEQKWLSYLRDPADFTCLCIAVDSIDKRRRLYRAFAEGNRARVVPCERPKGDRLRRWVREELSSHGKDINADALRMIADYDVPLDQLRNELSKLVTYVGDRKAITADEVARLTAIPREEDIFALVDAVGMGNSRDAVVAVEGMLEAGADPLMLLGMIARQVRLIWHVRSEIAAGADTRRAAKLLGQHPFVVQKCARQGRNFSRAQLERALELVLETDLGIKTGKWRPEMAIQRLVAVLSNPELRLSGN